MNSFVWIVCQSIQIFDISMCPMRVIKPLHWWINLLNGNVILLVEFSTVSTCIFHTVNVYKCWKYISMLTFETNNSLIQKTVMQINNFIFQNKHFSSKSAQKCRKIFVRTLLASITVNVLIAFATTLLTIICHFLFVRTIWMEYKRSLCCGVWHARSKHRTADNNQTSEIHRLCVILLLFRWTDCSFLCLFYVLSTYVLLLPFICTIVLSLLFFLFFFSSI